MNFKLKCLLMVIYLVILTGCYNHTVIPKEEAFLNNIDDDIVVVLNDTTNYEIMHNEYSIENDTLIYSMKKKLDPENADTLKFAYEDIKSIFYHYSSNEEARTASLPKNSEYLSNWEESITVDLNHSIRYSIKSDEFAAEEDTLVYYRPHFPRDEKMKISLDDIDSIYVKETDDTAFVVGGAVAGVAGGAAIIWLIVDNIEIDLLKGLKKSNWMNNFTSK